MQDVPKIVLKRLQETAVAGAHPDADILTAFAEQSLAQSERARVMQHLARCSDCRGVVALALPASEVTAVTSSTSSTRTRWFSWPVLRWSVVVVGIIAIASFGILQHTQRQKNELVASNVTPRNETAANAVQPLPPSPAASDSQSVILQAENEKETDKRAETRKKALSSRTDNSAADRLTAQLNPNLPAARVVHGAGSGSATGGGFGFGPGGGVAPKAALSAPRESSTVNGDLKNATPTEAARLAPSLSGGQVVEANPSSQTIEVESQAAPVTGTAESQVANQLIENQKEQPSQYRSSTTVGVIAAKDAATVQDVLSLQRASVKWSISADGALQCSFDAGNTWVEVDVKTEPVASRSEVGSAAANTYEYQKGKRKVEAQRSSVFRAVSAFGAEVWAGGSAAILYHSADSGAHWTRVLPSSSGATLTGDITSIEFSDARHGRIVTSAGKVWITVDDGQTWLRQ